MVQDRAIVTMADWGGFLSADLTGMINALFRHLVRFVITSQSLID